MISSTSFKDQSHAYESTPNRAMPVARFLSVMALFFVAPLVAEFLLGNMTISHLGMLGILAPLYGGGALLIREFVRKTGRGWPSMFVLALAYGVLEEAFLMQSIFNPNFLGQHLHLLDHAYITEFGIGGWYTTFVLTLHTVWSISVPIALVESLAPKRAATPWLGWIGTTVIAILFALACISMASFSIRTDPVHFIASRLQFIWSAIIILLLIALAFCLPKRTVVKAEGSVPSPWLPGIGSFVLASAFLLVPNSWGWWAVLAYASLYLMAVVPTLIWSRRAGWRSIHSLSLAGGAAMAYAWHAFVLTPSIGELGTVSRIGNLLFAILAANLIAVGARKTRDV